MNRTATIQRTTRETRITATVDLDGAGEARVKTGLPFFDHLLANLARHGAIDLALEARGDLEIDAHHTVEDCGIVLGQAVNDALGERAGIARAGSFYFPLDEALARAVVDLSGRPYLVFRAPVPEPPSAPFAVTTIEGFFQALAVGARLNLHLELLAGRDFHHALESMFKATGRALRAACARDPRVAGVPSTKGVL